ncbi:hypothetical protein WJX72_009149 [[Myrmecia] bisecta]|uniref:Uncharacterized protein n=1 Tax=[Myrmecia] bisecta TaxID=41462 RepID=A0AAW1Q4U7_9CHLO
MKTVAAVCALFAVLAVTAHAEEITSTARGSFPVRKLLQATSTSAVAVGATPTAVPVATPVVPVKQAFPVKQVPVKKVVEEPVKKGW